MRSTLDLAQFSTEMTWKTAISILSDSLNSDRLLPLSRHPLGFLRGDITSNGKLALRLHIWSDLQRYEQHPLWPIHSHSFDLISVVLVGAVRNQIYALNFESNEPSSRIYGASYEGSQSVLAATDTLCLLGTTESQTIHAGGTYSISHGVYHQTIVPIGTFAATLVLTTQVGGVAGVLGDAKGAQEYRYARKPIADAEARTALNALRKRLSAISI